MSAEIPQGLTELLEEFAIAVLREKPGDLIAFAAQYFNTRLAARPGAEQGSKDEEGGMETDKPLVASGEQMEVGNEGNDSCCGGSAPSHLLSPAQILMRRTFPPARTGVTWRSGEGVCSQRPMPRTMKRIKRRLVAASVITSACRVSLARWCILNQMSRDSD